MNEERPCSLQVPGQGFVSKFDRRVKATVSSFMNILEEDTDTLIWPENVKGSGLKRKGLAKRMRGRS